MHKEREDRIDRPAQSKSTPKTAKPQKAKPKKKGGA
jgi:hypothetical protein